LRGEGSKTWGDDGIRTTPTGALKGGDAEEDSPCSRQKEKKRFLLERQRQVKNKEGGDDALLGKKGKGRKFLFNTQKNGGSHYKAREGQ